MKKIWYWLILLSLSVVIASGCEHGKMDGFSYYELSGYLSSIKDLSQIQGSYPIRCGEKELVFSYETVGNGPKSNDNRMPYNAWDLNSVLKEKRLITKPNGSEEYWYYSILDEIDYADKYLGNAPNNFAYTLEKYGFKSIPDWQEWIQYNIPATVKNDPTIGRGCFNAYRYDPVSNEFTYGLYARECDESTEVYIVYQEISLFYGISHYWAPYFVSEELHEKMKTEFGSKYDPETYMKLSATDALRWFMGEYIENPPPVFANMKDDIYVHCFDAGIGSLWWKIHESNINDISLFIDDMDKIGIDIEKIKCYIIKVTVPHEGSINDIVWELMGK